MKAAQSDRNVDPKDTGVRICKDKDVYYETGRDTVYDIECVLCDRWTPHGLMINFYQVEKG